MYSSNSYTFLYIEKLYHVKFGHQKKQIHTKNSLKKTNSYSNHLYAISTK